MSKDNQLKVAGMTLARGVVLLNKEDILARGGAGEVLSEEHYEPHNSGSISRDVNHNDGHLVTRVVRSRSSIGNVHSETYFNLARKRNS